MLTLVQEQLELAGDVRRASRRAGICDIRKRGSDNCAAICAAQERRVLPTALALVFAAHLSLYPLYLVRRRCHSDSGPGLSPPQAIPLTLQLAEGSSVPRAACQLATCSLLGAGLLLAGSGALAQHQGAGTWEWLDSTYGFILVRISARALRACA